MAIPVRKQLEAFYERYQREGVIKLCLKSQGVRVKSEVKLMKTMTTATTDFLLGLFDQIRDANTHVAEMARALEEKDRRNASLADKLDAVLDNQRQQRLDLET